MYFKLEFDDTPQYAAKKCLFFNAKHGRKFNIMYDCHGNQNKTLCDGPIIIYIILFNNFRDYV